MSVPRQLTPDQTAAVNCPGRVCFVMAPAGSGKTEVLIRRVIRILDESQGQSFRLLAVTFTLKAADELRQRVQRTVGDEAWRVDADTIHGFALDWLRRFGAPVGVSPDVVVYSERRDRVALLRKYFETLGEQFPDENTLRDTINKIDELRTDLLREEEISAQPVGRTGLTVKDIYQGYLSALEGANGIDFPGMLSKFLELLEADPSVRRRFQRAYHHLFVDEGQDLTCAQADLLGALVGDSLQLFVVADDRQSIQGWAGGGIEWARRLVGPDAHELKLKHNFRCATEILQLAKRVAQSFVSPRSDAQAPAGAPPGSIAFQVVKDQTKEAQVVCDWIGDLLNEGLDEGTLVEGESPDIVGEEIGVIGRTRYTLDDVQNELERRGIKVSIRTDTGSLLESSEARLLHAVLEIAVNPNDQPALRRMNEELRNLFPEATIESVPDELEDMADVSTLVAGSALEETIETIAHLPNTPEGFERLTDVLDAVHVESDAWRNDLKRLQEWSRAYGSSTRVPDRSLRGFLLHLFRVQRTRPEDPGIRLLTAHRAKGLEFKAVAVVGLIQGTFPDYRTLSNAKQLDEERRAFYVAITRASRALLLTCPRIRTSPYGQRRAAEPSQFLRETGLFSSEG